MSKKCFRCGVVKPLEEFYRHPRMADGHLNKCAVCTRKDVRRNRLDRRDYYNKYDSRRYQELQRWPERDHKKRKATAMVNIRVKRGTMVRPAKCSRCDSTERIEAHHEDYDKPLEVTWLCRLCHADEHAIDKVRTA